MPADFGAVADLVRTLTLGLYHKYQKLPQGEGKQVMYLLLDELAQLDRGYTRGRKLPLPAIPPPGMTLKAAPEVQIPTSADHAELMQKLGYAYLLEHAPERLTHEARMRDEEASRYGAHLDNAVLLLRQVHSIKERMPADLALAIERFLETQP